MKISLVLLFITIISGIAFAQEVESYKMSFTLSENEAHVLLEIDVGDSGIKSMNFRTDELLGFRVYDSKGPLEYKINETSDSTITQVFLRDAKFFLEFSSEKFIFTSGDIKQFLADLSLEFSVKQMQIVVKLPVGYITDSHFPRGAEIISDGSRIILTWDFENPRSALISVRFRKAEELSMFPILIGFIAVVVALLGIFYYRKRSYKEFLQGFSEDEAKVIEFVKKNKIAYQNNIEKEFHFSRAKMTRIVQKLAEKGIVEKKKKGRTNRLTWAKGKRHMAKHEKKMVGKDKEAGRKEVPKAEKNHGERKSKEETKERNPKPKGKDKDERKEKKDVYFWNEETGEPEYE
ncbi:MAG: hypothetical protein HYW25_05075 [Candidatus Aenigmarchaeota archaeon]|nr:hypothetical protein [Candidatus Aenigmarchaeota archaeon]